MAPLQPLSSHIGLILPLCTTSATLGLSLFQYPVFASFLNARPTTLSGPPFSAWWAAFLPGGAGLTTATCATSALGGLLAARWLRAHSTLETTDVAKWYSFGAMLAAGHLLFLPLVGAPVRRIIRAGKVHAEEVEAGQGGGLLKRPVATAEDEGEAKRLAVERVNREEMRTWFLWHTVRTLVVDVPALWCFAEGAALSFWII